MSYNNIKIVVIAVILGVSGIFYSCNNKMTPIEKESVGTSIESNNNQENHIETRETLEKEASDDFVNEEVYFVYVCGAVMNPGVYELNKNSRIIKAVEASGGFLESADKNFLNLADYISDGMKIYVPTMQEVIDGTVTVNNADGNTVSKVNINSASKEELMNLNGIGEAKARAIIDYRSTNGRFEAIEDIKKIPGIKESAFEKIRDNITV